MAINPTYAEKFLKLAPDLEALWQKLNSRNTTLKGNIDYVKQYQDLMSNFWDNESQIFTKLQDWISYSAKLDKQWSRPDCALYTVLPPVSGIS
jgi:hypothetical protein